MDNPPVLLEEGLWCDDSFESSSDTSSESIQIDPKPVQVSPNVWNIPYRSKYTSSINFVSIIPIKIIETLIINAVYENIIELDYKCVSTCRKCKHCGMRYLLPFLVSEKTPILCACINFEKYKIIEYTLRRKNGIESNIQCSKCCINVWIIVDPDNKKKFSHIDCKCSYINYLRLNYR